MIQTIVNNIDNINFYSTSYREYKAVYKNHLIYSYPFVLQIYKMSKETTIDTSCRPWLTNLTQIFSKHHIDYKENNSPFDPCVLYEQISKTPIHTNEKLAITLEIKDTETFILNKHILDNLIIKNIRKEKLQKINTKHD